MPRLFHLSEESDIEPFVPRPPQAHPESESLVWAIDEAHSPFYLLPRECPRIGIWNLEHGPQEMQIYVQENWRERIQQTTLYRYEFDPSNFVDRKDHGVWTSSIVVEPIAKVIITQLEEELERAQVNLHYILDLKTKAEELYDFERNDWKTSLHVSMTRMRNLADWPYAKGKPTVPKI